jgi:hypothetical protein
MLWVSNRRRVGVLASALLTAQIAGGCGANTNPDTAVIKAGDASVLIETQKYTGDVGGVGIRGTLTLVDGCVGFGPPGLEVLAVFAPGTRVSGSNNNLIIHTQDQELRLGDNFDGGSRTSGGGAPLSSYGDLAEQAPKTCRSLSAYAIDFEG